MHFILISKKESFKEEHINQDLLNSIKAPSLISREVVKFEISNFIIYIYPYDHIEKEVYGYSYYGDENQVLICNGIVNLNRELRNEDISEFFRELDDVNNLDLMGDYQIISIDKNGGGYIKTPPIGLKQLFFYEDEHCEVIATEIQLIVDVVNKFREKNFVHYFDPDFIEDSIFREWSHRNYPQNTIFKEIKRIFPYDNKYFKEDKLVTEQKLLEIPLWFKEAYSKDKKQLYNDYYGILLKFVELNLVKYKDNIENFILGLTGGYDSRLSVAIVSKICKEHQIPLTCYTSGAFDHPDVNIARKIAQKLNIKHFHHLPDNDRFKNAETYDDYIRTFYMAQGDWNSNDYVPYYERKISSRESPLIDNTINPAIGAYPVNEHEIYHLGLSFYKRNSLSGIYDSNRWTGRRVSSQGSFIFPLVGTKYELWFGLLFADAAQDYREFIYEILKRCEPELLNIPAVGDKIPQSCVEPYLKTIDSKYHEKNPFLWDYDLVRNNLKPVLSKRFNQLGENERYILEMVGLNELDYFFNKKIGEILELHRKKNINLKNCFKKLLRERYSGKLPRIKSLIKLTKEERKGFYIPRLMVLMDLASVANMNSFSEIEERLGI